MSSHDEINMTGPSIITIDYSNVKKPEERFIRGKLLGRGEFGTVYLVKDRIHGNKLAIKLRLTLLL